MQHHTLRMAQTFRFCGWRKTGSSFRQQSAKLFIELWPFGQKRVVPDYLIQHETARVSLLELFVADRAGWFLLQKFEFFENRWLRQLGRIVPHVSLTIE